MMETLKEELCRMHSELAGVMYGRCAYAGQTGEKFRCFLFFRFGTHWLFIYFLCLSLIEGAKLLIHRQVSLLQE